MRVSPGRGKVTVIDPAFRVSRQVALACQEHGILEKYVTSLAFSGDSRIARASRHIPTSFGRVLRDQLSKRTLEGLDSSLVCTIPRFEAVGRTRMHIRRRLGSLEFFEETFAYRDQFDQHVARMLRGDEGAVYANEANAYHTLLRSKELGIPTVLEGVWHPLHPVDVLQAEREHFGLEDQVRIHGLERNLRELELADMVITQSEFARKTFLEAGFDERRVIAVPLGVDFSLFSGQPLSPYANRGDELKLISVGILSLRKGTGRLLESVIALQDPRIKVHFVGVMEREFEPVWDRFAPQLGDQIKWSPPVSRRDLASLYTQSDALVLPTLCDSFGQVILEAMSSGIPVIVSTSCGAPVRDGTDGIVIPPADSEALADAIDYILCHPEERTEWGANAAEQARQYSWPRFRGQIGSFLKEFVAGDAE